MSNFINTLKINLYLLNLNIYHDLRSMLCPQIPRLAMEICAKTME